ncbi:unnamed protein product [Arctogadus glacialis]
MVCSGPSTTCQEDSCANMGICIQQWENYTCDCSMTSYTGTQCNDHWTSEDHKPQQWLLLAVCFVSVGTSFSSVVSPLRRTPPEDIQRLLETPEAPGDIQRLLETSRGSMQLAGGWCSVSRSADPSRALPLLSHTAADPSRGADSRAGDRLPARVQIHQWSRQKAYDGKADE